MKIALDPYMLRDDAADSSCPGSSPTSATEYIELSPRDDFLPFFLHPRVDRRRWPAFKSAAGRRRGRGRLACCRSTAGPGPDEDARQAAVRYWKRAIQITVDLGVTGDELRVQRPAGGGRRESEAQFWRSMEELLPVFEREGVRLRAGAAPGRLRRGRLARRSTWSAGSTPTWCRSSTARRTRSTRAATSPAIMRYAGPLLTQVHVADSLRPPGVLRAALHRQPARLHRPDPPAPGHRPGRGRLGPVLRHARRARLRRPGRHIMTVCVFAWEERAPGVVAGSTASASSRRSSPGPDRPHGWSTPHEFTSRRFGGRRDGEPLARRGRDRRRHGRPRPRQRLSQRRHRLRSATCPRPGWSRSPTCTSRSPPTRRAATASSAPRPTGARSRPHPTSTRSASPSPTPAPRDRRGGARRRQARALREAARPERRRRPGHGGRRGRRAGPGQRGRASPSAAPPRSTRSSSRSTACSARSGTSSATTGATTASTRNAR